MTDDREGEDDGAQAEVRSKHVSAPLYLLAPPPAGVICCRCDEPIADEIAVNVPGLRARGWSHRACLPDWLFA